MRWTQAQENGGWNVLEFIESGAWSGGSKRVDFHCWTEGFSKSQTHVCSNESLPLQSSVSSSSHCSISPKTQAGESLKAAASSHRKDILETATRCWYWLKTWKIETSGSGKQPDLRVRCLLDRSFTVIWLLPCFKLTTGNPLVLIDFLVGHNRQIKQGIRGKKIPTPTQHVAQHSIPLNYFLIFFNCRSDQSVSGGGNVRAMMIYWSTDVFRKLQLKVKTWR